MFWSTIQARLLPIGIEFEAELGGDHYLVPERSESFAHEFFILEWTVGFRGIEECNAALNGGPDKGSSYHPPGAEASGQTDESSAASTTVLLKE